MLAFAKVSALSRINVVSSDVFSLQELRDTITAQAAARRGSATAELAPFPDSSCYVPTPVIGFYERLYVVNAFRSNLSLEKY